MRHALSALLVLSLVGCGGGRFMYVEYGLDRMSPDDKVRVSRILTNNPDGRRESWYNKASHSQYTVTVTETYRAEGRTCRSYLIDDVYPYDSPNRAHRQLDEHACFDNDTGRWFATDHAPRPFIQVGGTNYHNYRR